MNDLKNSAGSRDQQDMHNIEDARVNVPTAPQQPPQRKWVERVKVLAKLAKNPLIHLCARWCWDNADSITELLSSILGLFQ